MTPSLVSVRPSSNPAKKLTAVFSDGSKVDFGAAGYMDYTMYVARNGAQEAERKRAAYIARHRVGEQWLNPLSPGTLSRIVLWQFPTIERAIAEYDKTLKMWRKKPWLRYI